MQRRKKLLQSSLDRVHAVAGLGSGEAALGAADRIEGAIEREEGSETNHAAQGSTGFLRPTISASSA
jgi:hypothetical protein